MADEDIHISVVVPFHDEQDNLVPLVQGLTAELDRMGSRYEILLVDDGSTDGSLTEAIALAQAHAVVRCAELTRNFGQENAILAGLSLARGRLIITMDADLQHPAALLPLMIKKSQEGYDVVNMARSSAGVGTLERGLVILFYRVRNALSDAPVQLSSFNFRLMTRAFLNEFLRLDERTRFDLGLVQWLGFKQYTIGYDAHDRHRGRTKYPIGKRVSRAIGVISAGSTSTLRVLFYLGLASAAWCVLVCTVIVYVIVTKGEGLADPRWLFVHMSGIGAFLCLAIGIMAEYLANVHNEVKKRPLYVIRRVVE